MKLQSKKRDFLSMADISKEELFEILDITAELKKSPYGRPTTLSSKSIALIFAKPSLRTRVSFEIGVHQLGGQPITIKMDEINIGKREDVKDIANVLSRYVDAIVIRTFEQKQIEDLASNSTIPVVNALTNEEHPCQAVSDIFTIKETFKNLEGLKLSYIGDGNNVAHSLLICSALAGLNIFIGTPKGYEPKEHYVNLAKKINPKIDVVVTNDPKEAAKDAHVLYTDVWASMGQEEEANERRKTFSNYQLNDELCSITEKNSIVLHCLPAHREEEITTSVFNKNEEAIYRQAENRLHAQKAIITKLFTN